MYSNSTSASIHSANTRLKILAHAFRDSFKRFNPRVMRRNPVILLLAVAATVSTLIVFMEVLRGFASMFNVEVTLILWLTLLLANFVEAAAGERAKLDITWMEEDVSGAFARRLDKGVERRVRPEVLKKDDTVLCEAGDTIPADGVVVQGMAVVDESAVTGQSPPVMRENTVGLEAVYGKTTVLGGRIVIRVTSVPGKTIPEHLVSLVEDPEYHNSPDERVMAIPLWLLIIGFAVAFVSLPLFVGQGSDSSGKSFVGWEMLASMVALLIGLVPFTISELLNIAAIGGMGRLARRGIVPGSVNALDAAAGVDSLLIDERELSRFRKHATGEFVSTSGDGFERAAVVSEERMTGTPFPSRSFRGMGVRTVMTTSRDPIEAADLAGEIGIDDFIPTTNNINKTAWVHSRQAAGHSVAVMGGATTDAQALGQANAGFIIGGRPREAKDNEIVIDGKLDKLIEAIETGRQLNMVERRLIAFGLMETFSLCTVVLPVVVAALSGGHMTAGHLAGWNIVHLISLHDAILSMLLLNVLLLALLSPLVLQSVKEEFSNSRIRGRLKPAVFGFLGLILPVVCIKLIDMIVTTF